MEQQYHQPMLIGALQRYVSRCGTDDFLEFVLFTP